MRDLKFTVFTPTYNRAHTLTRVFCSLQSQRPDDFEWLVVDDGSIDNTMEVLIYLATIADFSVRIIQNQHGGKHRAHNTAISVARGMFTVILDSDDELTEGALEMIWNEWMRLSDPEKTMVSGVLGNCISDARIVDGRIFSSDRLLGDYLSLLIAKEMVGEKLPCYRTDILRQYPFPERAGEVDSPPEGLVWLEIGKRYKVLCINAAVRIYHRDPSDTSALMNINKSHKSSAWGKMLFFAKLTSECNSFFSAAPAMFIKSGINITRYGRHSKTPMSEQVSLLRNGPAKVLWLLGLFFGIILFYFDEIIPKIAGSILERGKTN